MKKKQANVIECKHLDIKELFAPLLPYKFMCSECGKYFVIKPIKEKPV